MNYYQIIQRDYFKPFLRYILKKIEDFEQLIKFSLVGILNTVIGYAVFFVASLFMNYIIALLIAHVVGVTNSFFWNKYWVFRSDGNKVVEFLKFYSIYALVLIVNIVLLYYLVSVLHFEPQISQLVLLPILTIITYLGHKHWSFYKK
jgi:putative flippase GtrA